jgi:hypothetical protein
MVIVKKSIEKWRMCMDFTHMNKACPNDSFPLPKIEKLMNPIVGFEFLSSLDANLRYHKILIHLKNEEKMSFMQFHSTLKI